jgi:PKD repeat protein
MPPHVPPGIRGTRLALVVAVVSLVVLLTWNPATSAGSSRNDAVPSPLPSVSDAAAAPAHGTVPLSSEQRSSTVHPSVAAPTWINVTRKGSGAAPPSGYAQSAAYDPVDHVTLLFGGCLSQCPSDQTWVFSNGTWRNVTNPSDHPPAREYASMDFDANMGGVLLFGGSGANGVLLNDTWLYHGGSWTNVSYVGGGPQPRFGASLSFDPAPEENGSVLFGGCVEASLTDTCFNDTWVWEGWAGWVRLTPSVMPPAVGFGAMAFDPDLEAVVFFGGCSGVLCSSVSGQTWELYSGQWWDVHSASNPSARSDLSMAYDPAGQQLILFGGFDVSLALDNDTWSFTASGWSLLSPAHAPSERVDYALASDPTGTTPLLEGGATNVPIENDTWVYEVAPSVALSPAVTTAETSQPVQFTISATGGTAPYDLLVVFGDGTSVYRSGSGPTFSVTHAYPFAGTFTPKVNLTDSVGAASNASASSVHVTAGPSITAQAVPSVGDVGIPFSFTVNVTSPGAPPLTYAWRFGDNTTGTGTNPSHAYTGPGVYTVKVTATDSLGGTANYSLPVTIVADPSLTLTYLPSQPNTTSLVTLQATIAGGTGPFTFSWLFGDGGSSVLPSPVHQFTHAGTYTVNVWVNDSLGSSAHSTETVTVSSPSSGATISNAITGAPVWFWGGIGALAVVVIVGTLLLARRRRSV